MRPAIARLFVTAALGVLSVAAQQPIAQRDLPALLARVGERVEHYYARAQSIVCEELVRLEPLGSDLLWNGSHVRRLRYELRVAWDASGAGGSAPEASVLRHLVSVDGRPPRAGDEPGCLDPKPASPEPLAMLLPSRQGDYAFTRAGTRRTRGGSSVMLDFRSLSRRPPDIKWQGECVSVELPGRSRGRVWLDAATADVLRLDEQLIGIFDLPVPKSQMRFGSPSSMTIERADSSIRYRAVTFQDPDETVILPASIVTLEVVRNSAIPRLRMTQTFSNYRRFVTDARIVKEP